MYSLNSSIEPSFVSLKIQLPPSHSFNAGFNIIFSPTYKSPVVVCSLQVYQLRYIFSLKFMEPCIARYIFYVTNEMQLIQCSVLLSALYMFRAVFRPSSGVYKSVCPALGIVMFSCCRQQDSMTIPQAALTVL
jgi:hypothetical protein